MTSAIPTSADELEELLADQAKIQTMLRDQPDRFREVIASYARAVAEKDSGLQTQVREQVQATLADYFRERPEALRAHRPDLTPEASARSRGHLHNPEAPGAALDGVFASLTDFLTATYGERKGVRSDVERIAQIRNQFSSYVPESGGLLIPEEFRSEILRTEMPQAIVRPRARVIPMGAPRVEFPVLETTDHRSSAGWYGGIVTHWTGEGDELSASAPKWGAITLDSNDLTAYTEIPNQLISDSAISVTGFVESAFPEALRDAEDEAFLWGNGVKKPLGVLHADNSAAVTVNKESGQPNDTIVWENLIKMFSRLLPSSLGRAVWIANSECFPELATMALSVGTGGAPIWLGDGVNTPPMSILGRPVIFTEKAAALGDVGDISLIDFGHYLIGDRQQMVAMWSEHFRFNTNTQAFRVISRLDGRPWLKQPVTPRRGSATLSPFVKLGAR